MYSYLTTWQTNEHWLGLKYYLQTKPLQTIYIIYKEDLELNNLKLWICHKTQPSQSKRYVSLWESYIFETNSLSCWLLESGIVYSVVSLINWLPDWLWRHVAPSPVFGGLPQMIKKTNFANFYNSNTSYSTDKTLAYQEG